MKHMLYCRLLKCVLLNFVSDVEIHFVIKQEEPREGETLTHGSVRT
jgi:hypothetical protein